MNGIIRFKDFTDLMHFLSEYAVWGIKTEFEIAVRNHHEITLTFLPKEAR
jgi:hypothetical protein